jgi:hypothetical protein
MSRIIIDILPEKRKYNAAEYETTEPSLIANLNQKMSADLYRFYITVFSRR